MTGSNFLFRHMTGFLALFVTVLLSLSPCLSQNQGLATQKGLQGKAPSQLRTDRIDNLDILVMPTAEKQFAFATFELQDPDMKKACFKALIKHFEHETLWCARASIALAMLYVGDYRFPVKADSRVALTILRDIPRAYPQHRDLCARSLWLCGWICQKILTENDNANFFYDRVINEYKGISANLDLASTWDGLARLEKVFMASGRDRALMALEMTRLLPDETTALFAMSASMDDLTDQELTDFAAEHVKSGRLHPIHSCRILARAWQTTTDENLRRSFSDCITRNYSDFQTREVQKALTLVSGRDK